MNPRPPTNSMSRAQTKWHGDVLFMFIKRCIPLALLLSMTPHLFIFPFMHTKQKDEHHDTLKAEHHDSVTHGHDKKKNSHDEEHAEHPDHIEPDEMKEEEWNAKKIWTMTNTVHQSKNTQISETTLFYKRVSMR